LSGLSLRERRVLALWAVVVVAGVSLSAAAAASRGSCGREIVDGNLDGGAKFVARDVIVYESGVFPGDPLIVRVVGEVTSPGWFTVRLPGLRAPDQMRVVGSHVDVTAYFVEDGSLDFFASPAPGTAGGEVSVYYIAGAGSWTHHFELDAAAAELALVAKVTWRATTMSFIAVLTPLIAVLLGAVVLGERPTPWTGLGGVLILGGVTLAMLDRRV